MAQTARRMEAREAPPVDPAAIDRAYRIHRARRRVRVERTRERARARWRFLAAIALLVGFSAALLLSLWHQIQSVFGL